MWNSLSNIGFYENLLNNNEIINSNDINFGNLCRTCLRDCDPNDINNLFQDFEIGAMSISNIHDGNVVKLVDMLVSVTDVIIDQENDNLPHQICNNCVQNVSGAYFYKMKSQKANYIFQQMLNSFNHQEPIEVLIDDNITSEIINEESILLSPIDVAHLTEESFDSAATITVTDHHHYHQDDNKKNDEIYNIEYEEIEYHDDDTKTDEKEEVEHLNQEHNTEDEECNEDLAVENYLANIIVNSKARRKKNPRKKPSVVNVMINFECYKCQLKFNTQRQLTKHIRTSHPPTKKKSYACEICDQKFAMIQTLKRHEKIHQENQRNKFCNYCNKSFIRSDDLKRHTRIHTNERPYVCDICNKSYKQTSELKDHQLIHTEARRTYDCPVCNKTLQSRNGMYVHLKVHANIRRHHCKDCEKSFVTAGELVSHQRHIHDTKIKYQCQICQKNMSSMKSLKRHSSVIHHNDGSSSSKKSNKTTKKKSNLNKNKKPIDIGTELINIKNNQDDGNSLKMEEDIDIEDSVLESFFES